MMKPRVDVLMTVYNAGEYLRDAIGSVLGQSYADFRLLLIDDGSSDNCAEIVSSFHDDRVVFRRMEQNTGLVNVLNLGLDMAEGDYIVRMDADDICLPGRIEKQVNFMDSNPSVGLCAGNVLLFGDENGTTSFPQKSGELKASLIFGCPVVHPSVILRTNTLRVHNLNYNPAFTHIEDWELWYRLSKVCDFGMLPDVILKYRKMGQGITSTQRRSSLLRRKNIYAVILGDVMGHAPSEEELDLHCWPGSEHLPVSAESLGRYRKWLELLNEKNKRSGVFPPEDLQQVLAAKWEKLFYWLADHSNREMVKEYFNLSGRKEFRQSYYFFRRRMKRWLNKKNK